MTTEAKEYRVQETYKVTHWTYIRAESPKEALDKFGRDMGEYRDDSHIDEQFRDWKPTSLEVKEDRKWLAINRPYSDQEAEGEPD